MKRSFGLSENRLLLHALEQLVVLVEVVHHLGRLVAQAEIKALEQLNGNGLLGIDRVRLFERRLGCGWGATGSFPCISNNLRSFRRLSVVAASLLMGSGFRVIGRCRA